MYPSINGALITNMCANNEKQKGLGVFSSMWRVALDSAVLVASVGAGLYFLGAGIEENYLVHYHLSSQQFLPDHTRLIAVGFKTIFDLFVHHWLLSIVLFVSTVLRWQNTRIKAFFDARQGLQWILVALVPIAMYLLVKYSSNLGEDYANRDHDKGWARLELKNGRGSLFGQIIASTNEAIALELDSHDVVVVGTADIQLMQIRSIRFPGKSVMPTTESVATSPDGYYPH